MTLLIIRNQMNYKKLKLMLRSIIASKNTRYYYDKYETY